MRSCRRTDDRGSILVLSALLMVGLFIIVSLVIDLGQGRAARRSNQSTVDLAASAAGYFLAGHGGVVRLDAEAACEAAVNSAGTNLATSFVATTAGGCAVFPTGAVGDTCAETDVSEHAVFSAGGITLTVTYPVIADDIKESRFVGGTGENDGTERCKRMRVSVNRVEDTFFASIMGIAETRTRASAVVKGGPSADTEGVAALLLLEREGCQALFTSGQGAVVVRAVPKPAPATGWQPGAITVDSAGSTSFPSPLQCTTNTNASGYTIYGTPLPAAKGGGPSIVAESSPTGQAGIIGTYALKVGGRAAYVYPGGLNVEPTGSNVSSRVHADTRYNPTANPAIETLHSGGWAESVTAGSTVVGAPITDCAPADGTVFDGTDPVTGAPGQLTFDCPATGFAAANGRTVRIVNAATVKFIGSVDVVGTLQVSDARKVVIARPTATSNARLTVSGTASFDDVSTFYIGGTPNTCTTVNLCSAIRTTGTLRINTGDVATASCADGPGADPGSTATNWAALATFGGPVTVTGSVSWCQTAVYVGRSLSSYAPQQRTGGGINCTVELPCPLLSTANSRDRFSLSGGGSSVLWTAPDRTSSPPTTTTPFEGLSLWVEGTGLSEIKGTGALETTGVFFLPNAMFEFDGQAAASNPFDAQFFARSLNFAGQGDLNLRPDPTSAVPTPIPGDFQLIR